MDQRIRKCSNYATSAAIYNLTAHGRGEIMITKQCDKHKISYDAQEKQCPWCYYENHNRNTALIIGAVIVAIILIVVGAMW